MPKIKINKFDGIYTNVDENDLRLDLFKDSVNFRHEQGYVKIELPLLSKYTLPDVNAYMSTTGWEWETGIYTNITNDSLSTDQTPIKYLVLFLVAKKVSAGTTYRLFFFKELPSGTWYELSAEGDYTNPSVFPNRSLYNTTKDGEVFFREYQGVLRIYLPHDCFWFGYINRTNHGTTRTIKTLDQFYLDRLVEPFDIDNLGTDYTTIPIFGLDISLPWLPKNATNRRLGWSALISTVDDQSLQIKSQKVSFVYQAYTPHVLPYDSSAVGSYTYDYLCTDIETGEVIPNPGGAYELHGFYQPYGDNTNFLINKTIYDAEFTLRDGSALSTVFTTVVTNPAIAPDSSIHLSGDYYKVAKTDFESINAGAGYLYVGNQTVADIGFSNVYTSCDIIVTAVLDEREEIIVYHARKAFNISEAKFAFKFDYALPTWNGNFRLTRNRIYLKFVGEADFEMYKEFNYLDENFADWTVAAPYIFYLAEMDRTGVFLSQNTGFLVDEKKLDQYNVITGFRGVAVENSIGIGISADDYVSIYYSAVGGGNIQTDLMYTTNILPLPKISLVNALVGLNGNILAITDKITHVVRPEQQVGVLAFQIIDTLEFGVKNFHDVASMESQVFLNTANGIFLTNGYDKKLISEPINDICKANYLTSRIDYNPVKHELYYTPNFGTSESFYRYRLDVNKWEPISVSEEA